MKQNVQSASQYTISDAANYLLRLISCTLNGTVPEEKPETVSWEELFTESRRQNILLLAFESIKQLREQPTDEIGAKWNRWHDKLLTKGINQSVATEELLTLFGANGIRLLPMKGFYIRRTYPAAELREMTDLDVLVHSDDMQKARELLLSRGYCITEDHEVHAAFTKPPFMVVELHNKLLPDYVGHGNYYEDVWSRTTADAVHETVCHMNPSDTLTHIMLHFAKHYLKNGCCGIRFAVDFFTYCRFYDKELDWDYLWREWDKLNVRQLAEDVLGLGQAWFGSGTLTERQAEMGAIMCSSGVFGNAAGYDRNRIMELTPKSGNVKIGKLRYFLGIVFPPLAEMKLLYPCLEKAPILLPFTWVLRGFKTVFCKPKHIKNYFNRTKNAVVGHKK